MLTLTANVVFKNRHGDQVLAEVPERLTKEPFDRETTRRLFRDFYAGIMGDPTHAVQVKFSDEER
jgi:hypothetical protein